MAPARAARGPTARLSPSVAALGGPAPYWIDYTTNAIGNRTSQVTHTAAGNTTTTYTYPAATTGQPHAVSSTTTTGPAGTTTATYGYDETGNTETRTAADGSVQDLVWDAEGRLASAGPEETGSAFVYTAGGDRLIRREGGATANPAPPQVSDDFDRTVTSGWGSADIGGAWTTTTPGKFAVNGQVGTMSVAAGATVKTWLGDLVWTSADVQATVSTDKAPAGSGPWVLVQARRVTDDLHYAARVKLNGDGTVGLHVTAGDGTAIAGGMVEGLTFTGGERLRVRVQAEGTSPTTLRAKVWAEGDPEPAVWNVEATDTTEGLQTAGTIGIRAYLPGSATNAPVGVLVDDLSATPVGAQAAAAGTPATTAAATTATTAVVGPSTTVYLPGGQELRLDQSTGKVTATRYYAFAGQTVAMRTGPGGTAVTSLVSDPHGTATIAVANTTAATLTVRRFDPYANPRGPQVTWPGDHGFLDKPVDATGLVAIGARYYDPALGRFISVDPVMDLTDPQQWAAYSYANNNPTTYSDPTGLIVCGDFEGAGACNRRHKTAAGGGGGAASPPVTKGVGAAPSHAMDSSAYLAYAEMYNDGDLEGFRDAYDANGMAGLQDDEMATVNTWYSDATAITSACEIWNCPPPCRETGCAVKGSAMVIASGVVTVAVGLLGSAVWVRLVARFPARTVAPVASVVESGIPEESAAVIESIQNSGVIVQSGLRGPSVPRSFANDGRGGGQILPGLDRNGQAINYREWGTVPRAGNPKPGGERVVTGSDGSVYYSPDHYQTFIRWN